MVVIFSFGGCPFWTIPVFIWPEGCSKGAVRMARYFYHTKHIYLHYAHGLNKVKNTELKIIEYTFFDICVVSFCNMFPIFWAPSLVRANIKIPVVSFTRIGQYQRETNMHTILCLIYGQFLEFLEH